MICRKTPTDHSFHFKASLHQKPFQKIKLQLLSKGTFGPVNGSPFSKNWGCQNKNNKFLYSMIAKMFWLKSLTLFDLIYPWSFYESYLECIRNPTPITTGLVVVHISTSIWQIFKRILSNELFSLLVWLLRCIQELVYSGVFGIQKMYSETVKKKNKKKKKKQISLKNNPNRTISFSNNDCSILFQNSK